MKRLLAILFLALLVALAAPVVLEAQTAPPFAGSVVSGANLRAGPGTTYAIVGGAVAGQAVQVTGCNADCSWYQLDTGNWIAAFLVAPAASEPAAVEPAAPARPYSMPGEATLTAATVGASANRNANLREGPGTNYAIVGGVATGQVLELAGRTSAGDWYQLANGAWIAAFLVNNAPADLPVTASPVRTPPTPTPPQWNCDPSYPDVCIPPSPPDLDCGDISYRRFRVLSPDPHRFDGDFDGIGCERL